MRALLAFAVLSISLAGSAIGAPPPRDLAVKIGKILAEEKVPSVSIARINRGKLVYAGAFGEQSAGVPATAATLYNIASLTKPISAEVILRLASEGKIGLDEPMSAYWVDPDLVGDPRADRLTPRLALSHRTGFPNWRHKKPLTFIHEPGEWGYSGEGYQYVMRFAEAKTGSDLESLADRLVFEPSSMLTSSYTERPWFSGRIAVPADAQGKPLEPSFTKTAIAADLVYTTPSDYARFMLEVMKDSHLSKEIAEQRRTVQTDLRKEWCKDTASPACPDRIGMGLGWEVIGFGPHVYLTHTGSDDGVKAFAYLSPTSGNGLVMLMNGENGMKMVLRLLALFGTEAEFVTYFSEQAT